MLVRVKRGCKGFIYGERRKFGDVFDLKDGDAFSERWMEKLEEPKPQRKPRKAKASKTSKKEIDV